MEHFVHVSDVESDFVPLKGDQASLYFSSNLKYCVYDTHLPELKGLQNRLYLKLKIVTIGVL